MSAIPGGIVMRMWFWAAVLRPLKHVVPLDTLVKVMAARPHRARNPELERRLEAYLDARGRFPARPPANCLERNLAAYRLLCSAGSRPELVVGVRRSPAGGVEGHVWLTLDGRAQAETDAALAGYVPLATYDASGRRTSAGGDEDALRGVRLA